MTGIEKINSYGEEIEQLLKLKTSPIAVKFIERAMVGEDKVIFSLPVKKLDEYVVLIV